MFDEYRLSIQSTHLELIVEFWCSGYFAFSSNPNELSNITLIVIRIKESIEDELLEKQPQLMSIVGIQKNRSVYNCRNLFLRMIYPAVLFEPTK